MARYSGKNTDSKSAKGSSRGSSSGPSLGATSVTLTTEQQTELNAINAEIQEFKSEINRVRRRKDQVEDILDNFEQIAVGNLLVDILPDENSDEIKNSKIVSKTEIFEKLNISEGDINNNSRKARAGKIITKVFKLELVKELIDQSSELNEDELYATIIRDVIYTTTISGTNNQIRRAREKIEDVLDEIESDE